MDNVLKSYTEQDKKAMLEGKVYNIDKEVLDDQTTLEVGEAKEDKAKEDKDSNLTLDEFKVLYAGQIKDKCLELYGVSEDEKLLNDTAKEMFLNSQEYIPEDTDKAKEELDDKIKVEESKTIKTEDIDFSADITYILEQFDVEIVTAEELGSDYMYRKLITDVNEAEKFNYHSDYWGDADSYQQENVELMEEVEQFVGNVVKVERDEGPEFYKILGILIDRQYNSLSHTVILGERIEDNTSKKEESYADLPQMEIYEFLVNGRREGQDKVENVKLTAEAVIEDHLEQFHTDEAKDELISYIMLKANEIYNGDYDEDKIEESKNTNKKCVMCGTDNLDGCFVLKSNNICKECGKKYSLEEIEGKLKKTESSVQTKQIKNVQDEILNKEDEIKNIKHKEQLTVTDKQKISKLQDEIDNLKTKLNEVRTTDAYTGYEFDEEDVKYIKSLVGDTIRVLLEEGGTGHSQIDLSLAPTDYIDSGIVNYTDKFYEDIETHLQEKYPDVILMLNNTGSIMWLSKKKNDTDKGDRPTSKII